MEIDTEGHYATEVRTFINQLNKGISLVKSMKPGSKAIATAHKQAIDAQLARVKTAVDGVLKAQQALLNDNRKMVNEEFPDK
ncbi:MAG: hypothetical protein QF486_00395 [Candidatus Woesearchaeota archaeon]|jgi:hypothetical protein|nr:hypothetical protein [Candidatus Woesearchaeota archaeon]MDP7181318.1 hypothetical protein [Candidatus Woesearchaeota archaeon]MDP7198063.1 hypothetical protein [Candidatus Woesearchaeota archaeon]MDP7466897.1 hypothetical protein [Candidatus Woesearchaeota archaeon]MDP7647332.1 hypothetical protein [Candidatus Woesearchaeota archaeon]